MELKTRLNQLRVADVDKDNRPFTTKRLPGNSEAQAWARQDGKYPGFYFLHCSHDRELWRVCDKCNRNVREADANALRVGEFLAKMLKAR